ncbi:phosphotransferase [Streptomyces kaniharaensis]|uniref:Phosphotransferase n=1 Tax=Streptomyces kaniharaensis TaxID=212423 RepID=A0A6N7KIM1_9ACTN|nr:phosphotransferase [Streptomyces kaniharaensis]MQS11352.1 phosphotransferase [Streptomyces kaniharaensis]
MDGYTIDESLIRSLLRDQHPDLADLPIRPVAGGWDNQLWRLGDELAVRMPRTPRAPSLLRKEQLWLPLLTPRLPLPVPCPVRAGEPSERFPFPWGVTVWVPGEPRDRASIDRPRDAAERLAGFLRALHRPAPAGAPANPRRGVPLATVAPEFEERFRAIAPTGLATAEVRAAWQDAVAAPAWDGPAVWLHGDLHPANVVITDGTLAGVIDFGDLCAGDPAADLAAAWLLLPAKALPDFLRAYANADANAGLATMRRARGWALLHSLSLIDIGRAGERGLPGGQPTWGPAGRAALDRVLAFR